MAEALVTPSPDFLAVAFVVDSSIAISAEWHRIIVDYVSHMLKRLNETNPGYKLRMAFVTYATAETIPSPVVCKRFFTEYQNVTTKMREDHTSLGIGTTGSGGSRGMAALEGLVAAIELFDILRSCPQPTRPHVNHIFHIAASPPDTSIHPQCNNFPTLDSVTWEELPSELKKRHINFSSILLRQNLPRFSELHAAVSPNTPKGPWFNLRAPHSVLLSGFPMSPQKAPAKRPGETHSAERTPESKRPRLTSQVDASPKAPNTPSTVPKPSPRAVPAQPPPPQPQPQHQPAPQPPAPPQLQPPMPAQPSNPPQPQPQPPTQPQQPLPPSSSIAQYQAILNNMRTVEEQVHKLQISIQNARSAGDLTLADNLTAEWKKKSVMHQKFKHAIGVYSHRAQAQAAQIQAQANAAPNQAQAVHAGPSIQNNTSPKLPEGQNPQIMAQMLHNRSLSNSGPSARTQIPMPPNSMGGSNNMAVAAQMQKLIEAQQRTRQAPQAQALTGMGGSSNQTIDMMNHNITGQAQPQPQPQPQPQSQTQSQLSAPGTKPVNTIIWQGSLNWNGTNTTGETKEVTTYVSASSANPGDSRVGTWPSALTLIPTREPAVSMADLQVWMRRHKPVLCTFAAQTQGLPDPQTNAQHYRTLVQLLTIKHCYAVSAWTLPSGEQGNNVLFFPINNVGLVGAFFPVTGIPDIPKATGASTIPAEFMARVQAMTPEQRESVLAQWKRQQGQRQQQALLNQSGGALNNNNNNHNGGGSNTNNATNNSAAMNLAQAQKQLQQHQHSDMGNVGGNIGGVPGFGVPSAGNYGGMNIMNIMGMGQPPGGMMGAGMARSASGGMMRNGVGGNVSLEMLQSFMQRNQEGGTGGQGQG